MENISVHPTGHTCERHVELSESGRLCQSCFPRSDKRQKPGAKEARLLMIAFEGRCAYCDHSIGERVLRRDTYKEIGLRLHWDHRVPFAYLASNPSGNWLPACHVCNGNKSDRMFDSLESARLVLQREWDRKYVSLDALPPELR